MRSAKRYTNSTFTKRVDHEAGRHRPARAPAEPTVCRRCGARYQKRRWVAATAETAPRRAARPARVVVCPACRQIAEGLPAGFVSVGGAFVTEHREAIKQLLINEAERASIDNPLGRIMRWEKKRNELRLTTTTEHLAQRLGHALEKAYGGEVIYDFSHENKIARVTWRRE